MRSAIRRSLELNRKIQTFERQNHVVKRAKATGAHWFVGVSKQDLPGDLADYTPSDIRYAATIYALMNKSYTNLEYIWHTESSHPYVYSCPISFLSAAKETCPKWRDGVRAYHAQEKELAVLRKLDPVVNMTNQLFNDISAYLRNYISAEHSEGPVNKTLLVWLKDRLPRLHAAGLITLRQPAKHAERVYKAYEIYVLSELQQAATPGCRVYTAYDEYGYGCVKVATHKGDLDPLVMLGGESYMHQGWIDIVGSHDELLKKLDAVSNLSL